MQKKETLTRQQPTLRMTRQTHEEIHPIRCWHQWSRKNQSSWPNGRSIREHPNMQIHQHSSLLYHDHSPHFTNINKVSNTSKILAEFSSSSSLIHCSKTLTILGIMALNIFYHKPCQYSLIHAHIHTYNSRFIFAVNKFREFTEYQNSSDSD